MGRRETLEKKLKILEELEGIEESREGEKSNDRISKYILKPPRAELDSVMERLRELVKPF